MEVKDDMDELRGELWSERFAEWMRLRNWSAQTVISYQTGLRQFFAYLKDQGVVVCVPGRGVNSSS